MIPNPTTEPELDIHEDADCCRNLWAAVIERARKDAAGEKLHAWDTSGIAHDAMRFLDEIGAVR